MARRATGNSRTSKTPLKIGDRIQAEWQGSWWPAEVIAVRKDGSVKVHFPGWGSEWDEVVPRSRVRLGDPAGDEEGPAEESDHPGPVASIHLGQPLPGKPVSATTSLKVGDRVLAEQLSAWWAAEVVGLRDDGRVKVHYTGWEWSWDEVVPRRRLRLEAASLWETLQGKRLTLHLAAGWSLTGTFVEEDEAYLVLSLPEEQRRICVNKQRIVYFETSEEASS
ncbi:MAG TPA: agenet domain-containing protein [Gemmataceae bacterium]|nr:agenet domain-containing protein [Gemmataceae bacterium]